MTYLFAKSAICALALLALAGQAEAASPYSVPGTAVVIPVGDRGAYERPNVHDYGPSVWHDEDGYADPNSAGADEIRELQRAFPQTNWPSSMRYYERP